VSFRGQEQSRNPVGDISVVIPALNARNSLGTCLAAISGTGEAIVVDGGGTDGTGEVARACGARLVEAPRGRGAQLAAGIAAASGAWLLLLHADTVLQPGWRDAAACLMNGPGDRAGYFRLAFDSAAPEARRLERVVAWRSRVLGLPYGDQGLLMRRDFLTAIGGVRPLPLMEDVDLARRIGRARLVALDAIALSSASRYLRDGWRRRSARNLACLGLYLAGVPPRHIVKFYG